MKPLRAGVIGLGVGSSTRRPTIASRVRAQRHLPTRHQNAWQRHTDDSRLRGPRRALRKWSPTQRSTSCRSRPTTRTTPRRPWLPWTRQACLRGEAARSLDGRTARTEGCMGSQTSPEAGLESGSAVGSALQVVEGRDGGGAPWSALRPGRRLPLRASREDHTRLATQCRGLLGHARVAFTLSTSCYGSRASDRDPWPRAETGSRPRALTSATTTT